MANAEDFVAFFGTEFEEPEDEKEGISKKPLSVENQIVTDEKGRRRFHGAFTGGFSAGYFNSVGSKEGWTPASFKSSRTEREEQRKQRPEDFMDKDDLGEYGIAPREVQATVDFRDEQKNIEGKKAEKRRLAWEHSGVMEESDRLAEMIQPVRESVGVEMLKRMGWRHGQGIGPHVSRETIDGGKKVYGCELPPEEGKPVPTETEEMVSGFLLAPEDVNPHLFEDKTDLHGIGYRGLERAQLLSTTPQLGLPFHRKGRKGIMGQAFGVGAFEEDDQDIYGVEDISKYDYTLGDATSNDKHSPVENDFCEAKNVQAGRKFYASPKLPSGYVPNHRPHLYKRESMPEELRQLGERLNPIQRARLLGESYSVMSLINTEDRKRMEPSSSKQPHRPAVEREAEDPNLFSGDLPKQKRFQGFIAYLKRGLNMPQPLDLTEWEWETETEEFRKHIPAELRELLPAVNAQRQPLAGPQISRPFAHLLKSKFTHAKYEDDEKTEVKGDEDQVQAVKMKMFGLMTRKKHEWHPDRQLCKRFNLPNPYPDTHIVGVPHLQKVSKKEEMFLGSPMLPTTAQELANRREEQSQLPESLPSEDFNVESVSEMRQEAEVRLPVDLFKAIFASSDEEEDSGLESDGDESRNPSSPRTQDTVDAPGTSVMDALESTVKHLWTDPTVVKVTERLVLTPEPARGTGTEKETETTSLAQDDSMFIYGPALPPSEMSMSEILPLRGKQKERQRKSSKSKKKKHKSRRTSKKKKLKTDHKEKRRRHKHSDSSSSSSSTVDLSSD